MSASYAKSGLSPLQSRVQKEPMGPLVDRTEFRSVLKEAVRCIREKLAVPGLKPLAPEQLMQWFQNITQEDLEAVTRELDSQSET
jgi:hypothetical protein